MIRDMATSGDVIQLENYVDQLCMRHLHLMSNLELGQECLSRFGAVNAVVTKEVGAWHLRAIHPYRGVIDIPAACVDGKFRRLVAWSLQGYVSVKLALFDAWKDYSRLFGGRPQFAFMKKLPRGVEHGDVLGETELMLLEAEWMLERCVAVGGRTPPCLPQIP